MTLTDAHQETTRLDIHEVALQLNKHLGTTLVSTLAGSRTRSAASRWAKAPTDPATQTPRDEAAAKLRAALSIWMLISTAEDEYIARAWFIGSNPRLDDEAPVMALRVGEIKQVMAAARAFVSGADD